MENKFDKLIDGILETMPIFFDNLNGGTNYTCPFCGASKEVKATESVCTSELKHSEDCCYRLAQELYQQAKLIEEIVEDEGPKCHSKEFPPCYKPFGGCCSDLNCDLFY